MRAWRRRFLAGGLVLVLVACSGCKGRTAVGVCFEMPGVPGKVCVNVVHDGKEKTLTLPAEVVENAPVVEPAQ